jgi:N-acetylglucosaminyldiphosphoundecaprenol N-acetyl-beta-D-mannosaminyltransferase
MRTDRATLLRLAESCDVADLEGAARAVLERAGVGAGGYVCHCNVHVVTTALHDDALRRALDDAWKRFPDGAPVAWLQRRSGNVEAARIGGPDLMPLVVDAGRDLGVRHFLLGSTDEVLSRVEQRLLERFPGVAIAGAYSPPFRETAGGDVQAIAAIRAAGPDIVWCALGAPKQELWMHRHASALPGVLLVGVGAAFDFLAGTKERAPRWMRERGLEWLHRLLGEPARLGRRYARTNTEFLLRCGFELARRRLAA